MQLHTVSGFKIILHALLLTTFPSLFSSLFRSKETFVGKYFNILCTVYNFHHTTLFFAYLRDASSDMPSYHNYKSPRKFDFLAVTLPPARTFSARVGHFRGRLHKNYWVYQHEMLRIYRYISGLHPVKNSEFYLK